MTDSKIAETKNTTIHTSLGPNPNIEKNIPED